MKGDNSYPLTNFEIEPESIVQGEKETELTCVFVSDSGKKYRQTFFAEDLCTLNRFKKVLTAQGIELCFFGTDRDLEVFRDYIRNMDWKHKLGVKTLGMHKHNGRLLYVNPETAVAADGSVDDTIVQLEHHMEIESDILKHQPLTEKSDLFFIGENILSYNEYAKTVSVLGWTAACFIKGHLWALGAKFPHLILVGEGGSGKSTTYEKVISPIFSLNEKADEASQMTAFTLMLASASSNVIPQVIEEFKPSKIGERITNWHYNHFRSVYDRHYGKRGERNLTRKAYELFAPILVAGEENPNETAIRERAIELLFAKKHLKDDDRRQDVINNLKRNQKVLAAFGRSLLNMALSTKTSEVKEWHEEGVKIFQGEFPSRIVNNLACVYSGLKFVEKFCLTFGLVWNNFFPITLEKCSEHLAYAVEKYLLDGSTHNKSNVDKTFEIMARMRLKYDDDYIFKNVGKHLCINFYKAYDKYTRYHRDYAITGEVMTDEQFYKQLKETDYFIKRGSVRIGGEPQSLWVIDYEKLSQIVDVSGFWCNRPPENKADSADD